MQYTIPTSDATVTAYFAPCTEAMDPLFASPSTTKFLRDGQLFIRRGDKTYTIHGTEIK